MRSTAPNHSFESGSHAAPTHLKRLLSKIHLEALGIALWIASGVVAAPLFCLGLVHLVGPRPTLARSVFFLSVLGLSIFTVDVLMVASLGAVYVRQFVGPAYFPIHAVVTLLSAASLAGVLLLGQRSLKRHWGLVAVVCWFVGIFSIDFQYGVSEALFGIDGEGGPYSELTNRPSPEPTAATELKR